MIIGAKYNIPTEYEGGKDLKYLGIAVLGDGVWHNFTEWEDESRTVWLQCRENDSILNQIKRVLRGDKNA